MQIRILSLLLLIFINKAFALTLDEVMERSRKKSDEALAVEARLSGISAEKTAALTSNFLPEFSYFFEKTKHGNNKLISGVSPEFLPYDQTHGVEASYVLSNLYKGSFNFLVRKAAANAEFFRQKEIRNSFMLEVIKTYFSILEMHKRMELYHQSLKVNSRLYEITNGAALRGSAKKSAALMVLSQIEELKASIALTESELQTAKARFRAKTGLEGEHLSEPSIPNLIFKKPDEVLDIARKHNAPLGASRGARDAAKYQSAYAGAAFLPDITLTYRNFEDKNPAQHYRHNTLYLGARFYFYRPGMIAEATKKGYEYRASNYDYALVYKDLESKIRDLWARYRYYESVLPVKQNIVSIKRMVFKDLKEDNHRGRIEITVLLEEERKLIEAEEDLLKTRLNYILNIFEIKNIAGIDI